MPVHYKNKILLATVEELMPISSKDWDEVAIAYQQRSNETLLRLTDDIKRQWREKLCNKGLKPTGKSGDASDLILKAQRVELALFKKTNIGNVGNDDNEGGGESSSDDDSEVGGSDEDDDDGEAQIETPTIVETPTNRKRDLDVESSGKSNSSSKKQEFFQQGR